ncbi:DNA polymerase IV [Georgenia sp. Z1344]|uniref:DNA polymerase IV n=1 Tax=Georgenia sp. Z1344 TaxID=3416706 RepID=UPI003CE8FD42
MSRKPVRASGTPRRGPTPFGTDDSGTFLLHVDMDAFFAAVEVLDNPELAGRPVIVGGPERGVVSAATYEARAYGVRSAMPVAQARALCPQAVVVPGRHGRYREISRVVMEVLGTVTDRVEQLSVDEAFLDVRGAVRRLGPPLTIGAHVRARVREETGLAASVGIASTKHVAKIASGAAKPDGLLLVPAAATLDFLHPLPVGALWGVGEKSAEVLRRHGWETVGDVAAARTVDLERALGRAAGTRLHALAMGVDAREVRSERAAEKSIGSEHTFFDPVADRGALDRVLLEQSHAAAARLRAAGLLARTVSIKVRFPDFTTITRSRSLPAATSLARDVVAAARALLGAVDLPRDGLRLLGVRLEALEPAGHGLQLALDDDPGAALAEEALDAVRERFGRSALAPAALLGRRSGRAREGGGDDPGHDGVPRRDEGARQDLS